MTIHPLSMLACCFLLHFIAEYTLQGRLANLKQKRWWEEQIRLSKVKLPDVNLYRHDYKVGLACHAFYWSLVVCLPLLLNGGPAYAFMAFFQGVVHYYVDYRKANDLTLSLLGDQLYHVVVQIVTIWAVYVATR